MKIGIIGAGVAGLAAAVRMACRGYEVEVFEANAYPGGKLSEIRLDGYRFDAGPSLFTMPQYVDELFAMAGVDPALHFHYEQLPVVCEYFWPDGARLSAYADKDYFAREVQEKLGVPAQRVLDILADSERKYRLTGRTFLEKSLHRLDTWLTKDVARAIVQIPTLDLFTSMHKVHERYLQDAKLVQLFNRYATYNGSNPYKAPGLLSIIPHFEYGIGAFYPKGGMYHITKSIYGLAKQLGVHFYFNTPVEAIKVVNGSATALQVAGEQRPYDRIISNMDVFHVYKKLLTNEKQPSRILNQQKSTSALIFYWGINRQFPELDLHNIFFSGDYKTEFDYLEAGKIYKDPTVYVNITSKYTPEDAPAGCENWFTMINVPHNTGQDWDALITEARKRIIIKLSHTLQADIGGMIECEDILDPRTIESRTASHLGSLYGTSSNNRMAAFMRHPNFSRRIQNLYFCGGSVHPGGGIPLALLSAKIVDDVMPA
ncbi:MAG TPA: phytoene desaturase family protein [Saprospiraceae bacterium]|nr:phytoene desaturase family protein [Saprospiraceae bacterium]HMP26174.1 phytoene desaturase family protein [Saprospiraceae bacterium]